VKHGFMGRMRCNDMHNSGITSGLFSEGKTGMGRVVDTMCVRHGEVTKGVSPTK
jgi:hypothetical protein